MFVTFAANAKPDMMMAFFLFSGIVASFLAIIEKKKENLRMSWLFVAIATTTKYNAGFCITVPFVATIILIFYELKRKNLSFYNLSIKALISDYISFIFEARFRLNC